MAFLLGCVNSIVHIGFARIPNPMFPILKHSNWTVFFSFLFPVCRFFDFLGIRNSKVSARHTPYTEGKIVCFLQTHRQHDLFSCLSNPPRLCQIRIDSYPCHGNRNVSEPRRMRHGTWREKRIGHHLRLASLSHLSILSFLFLNINFECPSSSCSYAFYENHHEVFTTRPRDSIRDQKAIGFWSIDSSSSH